MIQETPLFTPVPTTIDPDFEAFRKKAYQLTGLDLTSYKAPQMQRRLTSLLAKAQVRTFSEYASVLGRDPQRRQEFRDFVTINVSEFFRDGDRFVALEQRIFPDLLKETNRGLRIWSAGCSNGSEPYSMSMILRDRAPGRTHSILASDIDDTILDRARAGTNYIAADVRNVGTERAEKWFTSDGKGHYSIKPVAKEWVSFLKHDLLRDKYPTGPFDMVACRNVVIYFTEEAKERIYRGFTDALRPGGILFVGGTEAILHPKNFDLTVIEPGFYRKGGRG